MSVMRRAQIVAGATGGWVVGRYWIDRDAWCRRRRVIGGSGWQGAATWDEALAIARRHVEES